MNKAHYVATTERDCCLGCNRKFTLKYRPHHCRRCGEIFCMKCLQKQTKLNKAACPDPSGKLRKVCLACFETSQTVVGCIRNRTEEFSHERKMYKYERVINQRANSLTTTFWRDQLDIYNECRRLLEGFEHAVSNSRTKKAFQEMREIVNTPSWQQSPYWAMESVASNCRVCKGSLGVLKVRRNCKVCGLALCKKCSFRELLVYYQNSEESSGRKGSNDSKTSGLSVALGSTPKLAIIKHSGAPTIEPSVSLLLHVCQECKPYLAERQTHGLEWAMESTGPVDTLISINNQIQGLQQRIINAVLSCQNVYNKGSLNENSHVNANLTGSKLSITLEELDTYLLEYESQLKMLKSLLSSAESKTQTILIRNYAKGKHEFLLDNRHTLRQLKKQ